MSCVKPWRYMTTCIAASILHSIVLRCYTLHFDPALWCWNIDPCMLLNLSFGDVLPHCSSDMCTVWITCIIRDGRKRKEVLYCWINWALGHLVSINLKN
jgi:hypothetical protein